MEFELTSLRGLDELDQALTDSHTRPVLLFKHSYTCGISAEALDELAPISRGQPLTPSARYAMVAVQTHRDVSNRITEQLGIRHETPQAILVRGGRAVWSASHFRVNAEEIQMALAAAVV